MHRVSDGFTASPQYMEHMGMLSKIFVILLDMSPNVELKPSVEHANRSRAWFERI